MRKLTGIENYVGSSPYNNMILSISQQKSQVDPNQLNAVLESNKTGDVIMEDQQQQVKLNQFYS